MEAPLRQVNQAIQAGESFNVVVFGEEGRGIELSFDVETHVSWEFVLGGSSELFKGTICSHILRCTEVRKGQYQMMIGNLLIQRCQWLSAVLNIV